MAEKKKTLKVTLEVKELVYDIQNKTHLTGKAREAEGVKGYEAASNMQASDDNEHSYEIRRELCNAFCSLKSSLGEYLNEDEHETNNLIKEEIDNDGQLELNFLLPSNFANASADAVGNCLHAYLVSQTIANWFVITNKADAQDYVALAERDFNLAKQALYKRTRPTRPTY